MRPHSHFLFVRFAGLASGLWLAYFVLLLALSWGLTRLEIVQSVVAGRFYPVVGCAASVVFWVPALLFLYFVLSNCFRTGCSVPQAFLSFFLYFYVVFGSAWVGMMISEPESVRSASEAADALLYVMFAWTPLMAGPSAALFTLIYFLAIRAAANRGRAGEK